MRLFRAYRGQGFMVAHPNPPVNPRFFPHCEPRQRLTKGTCRIGTAPRSGTPAGTGYDSARVNLEYLYIGGGVMNIIYYADPIS